MTAAVFVFLGEVSCMWSRVGSAQRIVVVVLAAMLLDAAGVLGDDTRRESKECRAARCEEVRQDGGNCSTPANQHSPNDTASQGADNDEGLFGAWLRNADRVRTEQPDWLSPVATTSGRLKQEFRYDVWDQPAPGGNRSYQLGGNKGLEFITSSRTQILLGVPSYNLVAPNGPAGGFGDLPLMLKFRIASAPREDGNYLLTFILGATAPTGSPRYGAGSGVLAPTLAFGKGWKRFDVQSTFGANLPTGDTAKLGRQLQWNTALQYEAAWKLWPELEVNSTFFETGKYAGETQVFLTPGIGFGRARLAGRFRFSAAVGTQMAVSRFHTYDHRWIFSQRFSF
jgi:hypothetical protein